MSDKSENVKAEVLTVDVAAEAPAPEGGAVVQPVTEKPEHVVRRKLTKIGADTKGIARARVNVLLRVPGESGTVTYLEVPVRPLSVEIKDGLLMAEKPTPPSYRMPMQDGVVRTVLNESDPTYVRNLAAWGTKRGWATVALIIDLPMFKEDGSPAESIEDRIKAVQGLGLSMQHFAALVQAAESAGEAKQEEMLTFLP